MLIDRKKNKPLMMEAELESIKDILEENRLVGGISLCFHDVAGIQEYYRQASKAIELGMRLKKEENDVLFSYEEFAFYDLMDIAGSQQDLRSFCNPLIFNLIDYDRENNTDLASSLYEFILSGNNPKNRHPFWESTETPWITVLKDREILGINISDPNVTWSLYLSFKIFELTGDRNFFQSGN